MEAAWYGGTYETAAVAEGFTKNYLQRTVAPRLWKILTRELGNGEIISKRRLRPFIELLGHEGLNRAIQRCQEYQDDQLMNLAVGGTLPRVDDFLGRSSELEHLYRFVLEEHCVAVTGAVGVGKTTLVSKFVRELVGKTKCDFASVIWWPIDHPCDVSELLKSLLKLLDKDISNSTLSVRELVTKLIECFRVNRYLLVLDGVNVFLQSSDVEDCAQEIENSSHEDFYLLLKRVIKEQHKSCLILTSRERIEVLSYLENSGYLVSQFELDGLDLENSLKLFDFEDLKDKKIWKDLVNKYRGNPLVIKKVSNQVRHFFGGNLDVFFKHETSLGRDAIEELLKVEFEDRMRLGKLGQQVMLALGLSQLESMTFSQLISSLEGGQNSTLSMPDLIKTLGILESRYLVESSKDSKSGELTLALQPIIKSYVCKDPHKLISANLASTTCKND